jgi:hypothetical protein
MIEGNLVQKMREKVAHTMIVQARAAAEEAAEERIKEAGPVLLAALLAARARLLVVYPADAEEIQQIDAALTTAGIDPATINKE